MVITWNELRDARERLGLTQEELSERLGVSTRTITNWEKAGVARKAEYKVERFFGEALLRDESTSPFTREFEQRKAIESMSLSDRADHEGWNFQRTLREVSDTELLEELVRRARTRGLIAISKESPTPKVTQREAHQVLRGERSRLTRDDLRVGGAADTTDLHSIDLSKGDYDLAASKDSSSVTEQSHPNDENESQAPQED